jgi:hypothetical protein
LLGGEVVGSGDVARWLAMIIDWAPIFQMAVITVVAAVVIVGVFALGAHSQATADAKVRAGRPPGVARFIEYGCIVLAALLAMYGLYLFIV